MASIVTSQVLPSGLPTEKGYTYGFASLMVAMIVAAVVALLIPKVSREVIDEHLVGETEHPELGLVAAGTLVGNKSE
jgi:uncharacterized membrane protein